MPGYKYGMPKKKKAKPMKKKPMKKPMKKPAKPEPKPVVRTVDKGLGSMDNPNETTKTAFRMLRLFNDK